MDSVLADSLVLVQLFSSFVCPGGRGGGGVHLPFVGVYS